MGGGGGEGRGAIAPYFRNPLNDSRITVTSICGVVVTMFAFACPSSWETRVQSLVGP